MKSLQVGVFWPAFDWIETPGRRFIPATYGQDLSNYHAKKHRDLVASEWYQARWGDRATIDRDSTSKVEFFENTAGGFRLSTSVGSGVTGKHGHVLIFDDLIKAQDAEGRAAIDPKAIRRANDYWFKVLSTRQADPTKTIRIGIMQRLHYEDTAAQCIDSGDYEVLCLPMEYDPDHPLLWARDPRRERGELLWPERYPREEVEASKRRLRPTGAAAQLQQIPAPAGGAVVKLAHFATRWDEVPDGATQIITVDAAFKGDAGSDRVAIQVWAKEWSPKRVRFLLLYAKAARLDFVETIDEIKAVRARWPKARAIHIEERANGAALINVLSREVPGVRPWPPKGEKFPSKAERVNACLAYFENGEVILPKSAPWVEDYITELTSFPVAAHDDQVDASTMALLILGADAVQKYTQAYGKKSK